MCPGVTGDAEQRGSAAAGRPSVDGSLYQGHGSAGSGKSGCGCTSSHHLTCHALPQHLIKSRYSAIKWETVIREQ